MNRGWMSADGHIDNSFRRLTLGIVAAVVVHTTDINPIWWSSDYPLRVELQIGIHSRISTPSPPFTLFVRRSNNYFMSSSARPRCTSNFTQTAGHEISSPSCDTVPISLMPHEHRSDREHLKETLSFLP